MKKKNNEIFQTYFEIMLEEEQEVLGLAVQLGQTVTPTYKLQVEGLDVKGGEGCVKGTVKHTTYSMQIEEWREQDQG